MHLLSYPRPDTYKNSKNRCPFYFRFMTNKPRLLKVKITVKYWGEVGHPIRLWPSFLPSISAPYPFSPS
ncbi:hypothetical protein AAMO2058_000349100 [Amorphochlora amoebiformis]